MNMVIMQPRKQSSTRRIEALLTLYRLERTNRFNRPTEAHVAYSVANLSINNKHNRPTRARV